MKPVLRGRGRRALTGLSAATVAFALGCAGALAAVQPAAAADGPHGLPEAGLDRPAPPRPSKATEKELRERLLAAQEHNATREPDGSARKKPGVSPYIIGGSETTIEQAPWMVQLGYHDEATGDSYFCGGALVAPNKVLTAAHCVAGLDWARNGAVLAGATDLDDTTNGTLVGVHGQWSHPRYNPQTIKDDIAVLTLSTPLDRAWLRLAASHDSGLYKPGTTGTVYGWGLTSGSGQLATKLRKAQLPMVADSTCDSALGGIIGEDVFAEGSMVCAGTPASGGDEGTTSPCNGDSGGPLVVNGRIAGVVSWGVEGCTAKGAYPVFSKVSSYTWAAQPRIDDADLTFDGRTDLLARTPSGGLFQQNSTGNGLTQREFQSHGWETASWGLQADLDRDWYQDLIIRDSVDGRLYRSYLDHGSWTWKWARMTSVWGGYRSYAIPGDLTGDARPDLVAVDANGDTYLYPGKGNGEFNAKIKVVSGSWKGVKVYGHGDLTGDGKPDLLAKDSANTVWLYRGTGNAKDPWSGRIKARTGWNFSAIVTSGDLTGDGIADLLARDPGSNGTLWLYKGTNKASADLFAPRVSLGTGFNQYNLLF
ncbi:trypsin-like serine protease [Streptomyces sp. NA04227]|uniref:trypsin-like serine protease n=1 Tax=Streptomyces sp. NA04227 TaxID=2742136 RepID=UPI00159264A5|nr:trypsin-like serine protease [Streptomyces sp. NA04227]QKW08170.1 trypsin-like serine protease [Streptomyces sp. NA04227]